MVSCPVFYCIDKNKQEAKMKKKDKNKRLLNFLKEVLKVMEGVDPKLFNQEEFPKVAKSSSYKYGCVGYHYAYSIKGNFSYDEYYYHLDFTEKYKLFFEHLNKRFYSFIFGSSIEVRNAYYILRRKKLIKHYFKSIENNKIYLEKSLTLADSIKRIKYVIRIVEKL